MSEPIDLAVVGVAGSAGELALNLLAERAFPARQVHALDEAASAGGRVEFRDAYLKVQDVATFDFSRVRIALFFIDREISAIRVPRAASEGCVVVDASDLYRCDDVPLVVPEVNAETLAGYRERNFIANPNAATTALTMVIKS